MSNFPTNIDTDLEIPRVDNNITEIGGEAINAIRDALFSIQRTLGTSLQGNKTSLASRLNVSIDADGNIKQSALEARGLATLPIYDVHLASNAAIRESKLDLDYPTTDLYNLFTSVGIDVTQNTNGLLYLNNQFSQHVAGTNYNHDGYGILINKRTATQYGVGGFSATNVGDFLNEIGALLVTGLGTRNPHIDLSLADNLAHEAEFVGVDASGFNNISTAVENVQEALQNIDDNVTTFQQTLIDGFFSNGIFKDINSSLYYNINKGILLDEDLSCTEGSTVVTFNDIAVSLQSLGLSTGDILVISSGVDAGNYQIRAVGPLTAPYALGDLPVLANNQIAVFHTFLDTSASFAGSVYGPSSVSSENAPLACSIKRNSILTDTVAILNPNSARAVSLGFNGSIISAPVSGDGYALGVDVGVGDGVYRSITIPRLDLEKDGSASANPVTAQTVAQRINAYVADSDNGVSSDGVDRHFPITAYSVGDELVIAHNWVGIDYTIEILDGYTGTYALGFDEYGADLLDTPIVGNLNNSYSVNGKTRSTLQNILSGTVSISSPSTTLTITSGGATLNPVELGVKVGSTLHISGHPTPDVNGSYLVHAVSTSTVSVYTNEAIPAPTAPTTFNVWISHAEPSLSDLASATDDTRGLVQVYVDENGHVEIHQRLQYDPTGLVAGIEIFDVSETFPAGDVTMNLTASGSIYTFSVIYSSMSGRQVSVQDGFSGEFRLYHPNNIDYLWVRVKQGTALAPLGSPIRVTISPKLNDDEALELGSFHFDGDTDLTGIVDKRLFGNVGPNNLRDDAIEAYSQRPVFELRSAGVAVGFDLRDMPYNDEELTGMQAVPITGGVAYVEGARVEVETQKVLVPSYDTSGVLITSKVYIIGINKNGTIRAFGDELGEVLTDGYGASVEFGTVLPLFEVTMANGLITRVVDIRKFINHLDEKVNLIVDESNNVVGNFRTLEGALLYAQKYPNTERLTVQIVNTVSPARAVVVPDGVSLVGNAPYGGGVHKILNTNSAIPEFITFSGNNRVENLEISSNTSTMNGTLAYVDGQNVVFDRCRFAFDDTLSIAGYSEAKAVELGPNADGYVEVLNSRIEHSFNGVFSEYGCEYLKINNNAFSNILDGETDVSSAIKVGSSSRSFKAAEVTGNTILVPSFPGGFRTLRGIYVDVDNQIGTIRIENNDISCESADSGNSAIFVANTAVSGGVIEELILANNKVYGIAFDSSSIYGIYVADAEMVQVKGNNFIEMGSSGNTNNFAITIDGASLRTALVEGNVVDQCSLNSGVNIGTTVVGNVLISDNYISGTIGDGVSVACNNVTVDGNYISATSGVTWSTGDYGRVLNNSIIATSAGVTLFGYGQVRNNSIQQTAGTGIVLDATADGYCDISGNTINGLDLTAGMSVAGESCSIVNNTIISDNAESAAIGLYFSDAMSSSLISGNRFVGNYNHVFYGTSSLLNSAITNNFMRDTTSLGYDIGLDLSNCVLDGNIFPDDATFSLGSAINNVIGINKGMLDYRTLSSAEGAIGYDSDTPHWVIDPSAVDHWVANSSAAAPRVLIIPISHLPNGARLESVTVYGSEDTTASLIMQILRRLNTSGANTGASASASPSSSGDFAVTLSVTIDEEIQGGSYCYYLKIGSSGSISVGQEIYAVRLNFRY